MQWSIRGHAAKGHIHTSHCNFTEIEYNKRKAFTDCALSWKRACPVACQTGVVIPVAGMNLIVFQK
jgi:hypothetical protein